MTTYERTDRTISLRERDRMSYDRELAHAILDEAWYCTVSFVVDGEPRALPTLHVRIGETVYLHGSTGSRPMLAARAGGLRVCLSVTLIDALVLARSQTHHSANYRSVVAHGIATPVTDDSAKREILTALVEKIDIGRSTRTRPPDAKELARTAMLELPLVEVSARRRMGGPIEDPEDLELPYWAGVIPLRLERGTPVPESGVALARAKDLRQGGLGDEQIVAAQVAEDVVDHP